MKAHAAHAHAAKRLVLGEQRQEPVQRRARERVGEGEAMKPKEKRAGAATEGAHVEKRNASIARMTRREAAGFFMICTICGLLITIWGLLA